MTIETDRRFPFERVHDIARIQESLALAVQEALVRHKRAGKPIAVWRNERVEWIRPEDIPVAADEGT
jgi:hypothetical protein